MNLEVHVEIKLVRFNLFKTFISGFIETSLKLRHKWASGKLSFLITCLNIILYVATDIIF